MQVFIRGLDNRIGRKRRLGWGVFLALGALVAAGCSEKSEDPLGNAAPPANAANPSQVSSEPPPNTGRNRTVGVSLPEHNGFYAAMEAAMETAAQTNSLTLDVQYADQQADKQAQQVEAFIQHKVDAILLCPADPQRSATAIRQANKAQIPIFTVHLRTKEGDVASHIGTDEELGGKLAAQKVAELLKETGSILLEAMPNDPNQNQAARARGFEEEIAHHPSLHLLHLGQAAGHGAPINAVFLVNDEAVGQDLSALVGGKATSVLIVGYGGEPRARAEIKKGQNYKADIGPAPDQLGADAMDTIARSLRGEKTAAFVKVVPETIDASTIDKP
ncbi:MAG TPA: substrate-binding domain-containing protein [Chthonomonadaceae bacterium]|nr:substrate-binding domain-containing protein [Chthonomonadaceae bacterium]